MPCQFQETPADHLDTLFLNLPPVDDPLTSIEIVVNEACE
jgi:hypothetical protein